MKTKTGKHCFVPSGRIALNIDSLIAMITLIVQDKVLLCKQRELNR